MWSCTSKDKTVAKLRYSNFLLKKDLRFTTLGISYSGKTIYDETCLPSASRFTRELKTDRLLLLYL